MNLAIAISRSNKSIVSLIILITIALNSFPQIAFEKNVNTILKTFQLENGSIKYFELNKKTKAISIYNMDNSLWKTINLEIPKNHYLGEIKLISQKTFNDDDLMEVLYTSYEIYNEYEYEGMEGVFTKNLYTMKLINDTGKELLKVPGGKEYKILNTNAKSQLMVYIADILGIYNINSTSIYSLK